MIRLFVADIDGCLSEPYRAFDLDAFATLRAWAARAEDAHRRGAPGPPRFSVCSGRSYAYVEAVAQALDLQAPVLFESGGGRFDLPLARIRWNPALTPEVESALDAVRAFFLETVIPPSRGVTLDYGKRAQAGIVGPPEEILRVLPTVRGFVTPRFPNLHVFETPVSLDVVPATLTKVEALQWLAAEEGLTLDEVAFIGDTRGDVGAIRAAGRGFAPQNAAPEAKQAADVVTDGAVIEGLMEAYLACWAESAGTGESSPAGVSVSHSQSPIPISLP